MSTILFTQKEQTEKNHTVADAIRIYKTIQADNEHSTELRSDCELSKRDHADKITLVELNDLVDNARNIFKPMHRH